MTVCRQLVDAEPLSVNRVSTWFLGLDQLGEVDMPIFDVNNPPTLRKKPTLFLMLLNRLP